MVVVVAAGGRLAKQFVQSMKDVDSEQMILTTLFGTRNAENEATLIAFYTNRLCGLLNNFGEVVAGEVVRGGRNGEDFYFYFHFYFGTTNANWRATTTALYTV